MDWHEIEDTCPICRDVVDLSSIQSNFEKFKKHIYNNNYHCTAIFFSVALGALCTYSGYSLLLNGVRNGDFNEDQIKEIEDKIQSVVLSMFFNSSSNVFACYMTGIGILKVGKFFNQVRW